MLATTQQHIIQSFLESKIEDVDSVWDTDINFRPEHLESLMLYRGSFINLHPTTTGNFDVSDTFFDADFLDDDDDLFDTID